MDALWCFGPRNKSPPPGASPPPAAERRELNERFVGTLYYGVYTTSMDDATLKIVQSLREMGAVEIEYGGLKVRFEPRAAEVFDEPVLTLDNIGQSDEEQSREFRRLMYASGSGGY